MNNFNDIELNKDNFLEHRKKLKENPSYKEEYLKFKNLKIKEYWEKLNPFKNANDVPSLPLNLDAFYIKKLIELGAIPKKQLIHDNWYYGEYRNSNFGKWDSINNVFYIIRFKFGQYYIDKCNHFEDDDGFALFVPLRNATEIEINNQKSKISIDF